MTVFLAIALPVGSAIFVICYSLVRFLLDEVQRFSKIPAFTPAKARSLREARLGRHRLFGTGFFVLHNSENCYIPSHQQITNNKQQITLIFQIVEIKDKWHTAGFISHNQNFRHLSAPFPPRLDRFFLEYQLTPLGFQGFS